MNMEELKGLTPDGAFEPDLIQQTLREILRGMHFLRHEAHVIHTGRLRKTFRLERCADGRMTDIQPKNILLGVLENAAFKRIQREEREAPLPRKILPARTVYISRPMFLIKALHR